MRVAEIGELSLLKRIRDRFRVRSRDVIAGIGDDAAVIAPLDQNLLLTTDMMVEGVHFDLRFTTPYQLGFKIVSVNVSDIYAMGGRPRFVLLDLGLDGETDDSFIESFCAGMEEAMGRYGLILVGGDLSSSRYGKVVSATLIGYGKRPVMRSGASPGDRIYVTGALGDSACGLELLKTIEKPIALESGEKLDKPLKWSIMRPLLFRHLLPEARNTRRFIAAATAMIDISDGLFIDLSRLCQESGVGAKVYLRCLPISNQLKKAASALGFDPYRFATTGGEDYEILFTASPRKKVNAWCIGEITQAGRMVVDLENQVKPFSPEGYRHWH